MTDWRAGKRENKRKIVYVLLIYILIISGIMALTAFRDRGAALGLLFLLGLVFLGYLYVATSFTGFVRMFYNCRRLNLNNDIDKQLMNVVDEIKIASSSKFMPEIYILKNNCLNAYITSYLPASGVLVINEGLLNALNRDELQSVVAHAYFRITNYDSLLMTLCTVLMSVTKVFIFVSVIVIALLLMSANMHVILNAILILAGLYLLYLLTPMFIGSGRIFGADAAAVQYTRLPDSMISALNKIYYDHVLHGTKYDIFYNSFINRYINNNSFFFEPMCFRTLSTGTQISYPPVGARIRKLGGNPVVINKAAIKKVEKQPVLVKSFNEIEVEVKNFDNEDKILRIDLLSFTDSSDLDISRNNIEKVMKCVSNQSVFESLYLHGFESISEELRGLILQEAQRFELITEIFFADNPVTKKYILQFKKICGRNLSKVLYSDNKSTIEFIQLDLLLKDIEDIQKKKAIIGSTLALMCEKNVNVLEISGFYTMNNELREFFMLLIESQYRLKNAYEITLTENHGFDQAKKTVIAGDKIDPYQARLNAIVTDNIQSDSMNRIEEIYKRDVEYKSRLSRGDNDGDFF